MRGINRVTLVARLGHDPDVKCTQSGKSVANMSVAVNEQWNDKDGMKQERVEWIRCVLWGALADVAGKYLHKGDAVYLEGRLNTREWDDRDGNKRKTTEVVVSNLLMLGGNARQDGPPEYQGEKNETTNGWDDSPQKNGKAPGATDDVPF